MVMATTAAQPKPQTTEVGSELPFQIPNWGFARNTFGGGNYLDQRETVPELKWPNSVRLGGQLQKMGNDTQIAGLMRGTTLSIREYVWGIDPNGAPQQAVDGVCRIYGLELIDDAWDAFQTGLSAPIPRAHNDIVFDQHLADLLKAPTYGHFYFEHWGPILGELWHPQELAARPPWSITGITIDDKGKLVEIRQRHALGEQPPIPASALVTYVYDKDPGDWTGRPLIRPCYREWLAKDELIRVDLINHANAGGKLIPTAPPGATQGQIQSLQQLSAELRVEGGGAVPDGTGLTFIRATGSDVIASINRHDEAMARAFLMMFMNLGTASSGGSRALASSFIDWFATLQESIAKWARDVFNEQVIRPYVDTNWAGVDYLPRLVFRRPESANPLDAVATAVTAPAGEPGAIVDADTAQPVAATRLGGARGAIVVDDETRDALLTAHALLERDLGRKPKNTRGRRAAKAAAATTLPLPDRVLRREPTDIEVRAAVDFAAMEANWVSAVDRLVAEWKTIRATQVQELHDQIVAADGDLAALASIEATAAGGDLIAAQLTQMAHTGAAEAVAEASRQGVAAVLPDMNALAAELTARAAGLEQILTRSLSLAAGTRAQRLTGGSLTSSEVAAQTVEYLGSLTDAYLQTQFGGAASAAQNAGRLAAMETNGASSYYASELLDANTCEECDSIDGTEYTAIEDAATDYPAGGYSACEGAERCRGSIVAIYDEAAPTA